MFLRKVSKGNWYVNRRTSGGGTGRRTNSDTNRNWFLIKATKITNGQLTVGTITFPEEFIGKKIRLKVEVIEDD